jgi:hypothetical protein
LERADDTCIDLRMLPIGAEPMSSEDEYRRLAARCFVLARKAASLADRTRLLVMAGGWLDLIDRTARLAKRQISGPEHPKVKAMLGARKDEDPPEQTNPA